MCGRYGLRIEKWLRVYGQESEYGKLKQERMVRLEINVFMQTQMCYSKSADCSSSMLQNLKSTFDRSQFIFVSFMSPFSELRNALNYISKKEIITAVFSNRMTSFPSIVFQQNQKQR